MIPRLLTIAIVILLLALLGWAFLARNMEMADGDMPNVDQYLLESGPAIRRPNLPCGRPTMEVRRKSESESLVVWRLNGKILAVVIAFDHGGLSWYLDSNLDGYIDDMGTMTAEEARESDASDFYRTVKECRLN